MIDWTAPMSQTFEFYVVDPGTWKDSKLLDTVTSCTINRESSSETLGSATIGLTEVLDECYVRAYLKAIQNGVTERVPLGTFLVQTPSVSYDGKSSSVTMDAYTPLIELKGSPPPVGYSLLKDTEPQTEIMHTAFMLCLENLRAPVIRTACTSVLEADFVSNLLNGFDLNSKIISRDKGYMVYIKSSEEISDFIKMLGAINSLFYYEDIRIYRDHKNMVNRLNNCEQANMEKSMKTCNEQLENIKYLKDNNLVDLLDDKIKVVINYREKYPETTMNELANIISLETENSISKSGINHYFRKIKDLVNKDKNKE